MYIFLLALIMNQPLIVPFLKEKLQNKDIEDVSKIMDELPAHPLSYVPWAEAFPYKPDVSFSIAHAGDVIYLKYFVEEKYIRAVNNETNGSVWEDSCVEFFISFDDAGYYNFECNSLGTFLLGYGKERSTRQRLPADVIEKIQSFSTIKKNKTDNSVAWTITWAIPTSVFVGHPGLDLRGKHCRANFYKCGDKTPEPHFITWANVETPKPDYHRPEFFGEVIFQ